MVHFITKAPLIPPPRPSPISPLQACPELPRLYSVPEPQPNPAPTSRSTPEAAEYTIPPEAWQVPALYNYCTIKRICSTPLKLNALQQAFAIILSDYQCCSYISESPGGFLGHLMAMLFTFTPTNKFRNSRSEHCFFLLQIQALLLLEDLFAGEKDVYAAPECLAAAVWNCVDFHIREALEIFEAV
ncbi:hypothetical protein SRHO_G00068310 [Serrasalmus rhombeus]